MGLWFAAMAAQVSHEVHAQGSFQRGAVRWGYFLLLNAIAFAIAGVIFWGLLDGESLDPYLRGTYEWLLAHPGVTSALAFSPLACSLLVGWGYSQRARKRKRAAAKLETERQARAGSSTPVQNESQIASQIATQIET
jgi:membrane associated rhomboid family serine protease